VQLRLANLADAPELAHLHLESGAQQPGGFMFRLGKPFLAEYYRSILLTEGTVILCAERNGRLLGFVSGTLRGEQRVPGLRKRRVRLAMAALPSLLKCPSLLMQAYARQKSGSADSGPGFIVQSGPHEEYWAWSDAGMAGALQLHLKWLAIMKTLGAEKVSGEFDRINQPIERIHRLLGARFLKEITTPDGRQRVLMEYDLTTARRPAAAAARAGS
jgi:hypothetical protein